jgi:hypothetical protein
VRERGPNDSFSNDEINWQLNIENLDHADRVTQAAHTGITTATTNPM